MLKVSSFSASGWRVPPIFWVKLKTSIFSAFPHGSKTGHRKLTNDGQMHSILHPRKIHYFGCPLVHITFKQG